MTRSAGFVTGGGRSGGRLSRLLASVLLVGVLAGCGGAGAAAPVAPAGSSGPGVADGPVPSSSPTSTTSPAPARTGPRPIPEHGIEVLGLEIPAIGLAADRLEELAVGSDGVLAAPVDPDLAGWFSDGPVPGERGPAVVAGHVDSTSGPAVFARLGELAVGDEVVVRRSDDETVTFVVDRVAVVPQDGFPTQQVYGPVPDSQLRLITCGGPYDRVAGAYTDNVVVFATEVGDGVTGVTRGR